MRDLVSVCRRVRGLLGVAILQSADTFLQILDYGLKFGPNLSSTFFAALCPAFFTFNTHTFSSKRHDYYLCDDRENQLWDYGIFRISPQIVVACPEADPQRRSFQDCTIPYSGGESRQRENRKADWQLHRPARKAVRCRR